MGKGGITPRIAAARGAARPIIQTDRQLVAAQHFNERLDRVLADIDRQVYPTAFLPARTVRQLLRDLEAVQDAVIGAIEEYLCRDEAGDSSGATVSTAAAGSPPRA